MQEHANDSMPHIAVNSQYIKDLSFENPEAPGSLAAVKGTPKIDLSLDLNVRPLPEDDFFEVELNIEAEAKFEEQRLFIVALTYAGVFHLINIPQEQRDALLAVHCPAIIFPFARKIIADATQDGGFQPLMIDPIDFGALYHKKMTEQQQQ